MRVHIWNIQAEGREWWALKLNDCPHPHGDTPHPIATPPEPSQTVPPTGDQAFEYESVGARFSFPPPQLDWSVKCFLQTTDKREWVFSSILDICPYFLALLLFWKLSLLHIHLDWFCLPSELIVIEMNYFSMSLTSVLLSPVSYWYGYSSFHPMCVSQGIYPLLFTFLLTWMYCKY